MVDTTGQVLQTIHSSVESLKEIHEEEEKTFNIQEKFQLKDFSIDEIVNLVKSREYVLKSGKKNILYDRLNGFLLITPACSGQILEKGFRTLLYDLKNNTYPESNKKCPAWLEKRK